uniref:Uncharacterized protein n=1 Tax=Ixodes ricinus TaxID=34613 RepID=A0A6B0UX35_IXORI
MTSCFHVQLCPTKRPHDALLAMDWPRRLSAGCGTTQSETEYKQSAQRAPLLWSRGCVRSAEQPSRRRSPERALWARTQSLPRRRTSPRHGTARPNGRRPRDTTKKLGDCTCCLPPFASGKRDHSKMFESSCVEPTCLNILLTQLFILKGMLNRNLKLAKQD